MLVPPIPNLEYLHVFDMDPLCYIDDISLLLLNSKRLQEVKLHWSPRMREAREPSIHAATLWGRCIAANYSMPLRRMSLQNLYIRQEQSDCHSIVDLSILEEMTFLNSTGGVDDDGALAFMDGTLRKSTELVPTQLKMARVDKVSRHQCDFLAHIKGLERLYIIGPQSRSRTDSKDQPNGTTPPFLNSPTSNTSSPSSTDIINNLQALKDSYLEAITKNHGSTLKHLLLLPQWRLTNDDIAMIVRQCPNLEQLGIGTELSNFSHLRLLVPFLSKLHSLRLLGNPDDPGFVSQMRELDEAGQHVERIGEETVNREWSRLRYIELGADDLIYEIGHGELIPAEKEKRIDRTDFSCGLNCGGSQTKPTKRRPVRKRKWDSVKHIEIWSMDSLDI